MKVKLFEKDPLLFLGDALRCHELLMEHHRALVKIQLQHELRYWRYLVVFFLTSLGFLMLSNKGVLENPLIGVVFSGLGCLFASFLNMIEHLRNSVEIEKFLKEGRDIEASIECSVQYFEIYETKKRVLYWCNLANRFLLIGIIGISTLIAGVLLVVM